MELVDLRVRSKTPEAEIAKKVGKILTPSDYNVLLTGPSRVMMPNGQPLLVYLPGILAGVNHQSAYSILHTIQGRNNNRRYASGSETYRVGNYNRRLNVKSSVIGYVDAIESRKYCRTTAWSGQNTQEFEALFPIFSDIDRLFKDFVPSRYAAQQVRAQATNPDWLVGNTVFTTMTVNNTYPTGVHTDSGDLVEGFSCLATWRRGGYTGGCLTFPEWRVAVDMQDGDLLLMDAHQWHGNTGLDLQTPDAERISLVLYYRAGMFECGNRAEEAGREVAAKKRSIGEQGFEYAVWGGISRETRAS